jgi:hypothetical protein
MEPDFSGWATKADIKCSDGRTITPEAFKHMDGLTVPLVWQHAHDEPANVLGHAVLEHREGEGVYTYGYFNSTDQGLTSKALVQHGDIKNLSIFANKLVERSKSVLHGMIREVSLVLSGANPGAVIENVAIAHSDGYSETVEDEAVIYTGLEIEHADLSHAAGDGGDNSDDEDTVQDVIDTMNDEQRDVLFYMIAEALQQSDTEADAPKDGETVQHAADDTVKGIFDAMTEAQKNVVYFMMGTALEQAGVKHSDSPDDNTIAHIEGETTTMGHNVFEGNKSGTTEGGTLSHDALKTIVKSAEKNGSLKEAFLRHAVEYGIENIDILFPEAKLIGNTPELIARRMEWVNVVLSGTRKSPFSRIKTVSADITLDQARAKGYVKGNLKKDEWFTLAKRITTPTTIYKKQKLDRDDIIDITDLDVIAFMKGEMRLMLDEEIARAILLGDGREVDDEDKINEQNIRPIAHDSDFYTHRIVLPAATGGDALVEAFLRARPKYRGSGQPTLFLTEDLLTDLLLGRDKMGRRFYENEEVLKTALRVSAIVTVDAMEDVSTNGGDLLAVLVNLTDYTVGLDRGGNVSMFDDFDIDYNQFKYLIETRMSGALTKFKSAQAFVRSTGTLVEATVPTFNTTTGVLTIPTKTGVVYRNGDTQQAFTAGAQPAIAAGATVEVVAEADNGYYFAHNTDNDWAFTRSL